MAQATGHAPRATRARTQPRTTRGSSTRSSSISWCGDGCSSSALFSYLVDYFHLQGYSGGR